MKLTPAYIEGFAQICAEVGLSEKQAGTLLEVAAMHLDFKDPAFREGFEKEIEKSAGFQAPDLTGMFSATHPDLAKGMTGAGWGGLAGGALGLASLIRPSLARGPGGRGLLMRMNPAFRGILNPGATSRASRIVPNVRAVRRMGAGAAGSMVPMTTKKENLLRFGMRRMMGPDTKRVLGGAALGGGLGAAANINFDLLSGYGANIPALNHRIPDNMSPDGVRGLGRNGQAQSPSGGGNSPSGRPYSPFDPVGSVYVNGPGGAAAGSGVAPSPVDQQMAQLEAQLDRTGSIDGALRNNRIRKQMADLERVRVRENSEKAIFSGQHNSSMAGAGMEIARKLKQVEKAIRDREARAGDAASWMERSSGPMNFSNLLPQLANKALGNQAGAQQVSAELQELYRARQALNQQLAQAGQNS